MDSHDAEMLVLAATGRAAVHDALGWIAEGRRLRTVAPAYRVLAALAALAQGDLEPQASAALVRLVRTTVRSDIDTSNDLLDFEGVTKPNEYSCALDELASFTSTRSLANVTADAVAAAQARNPLVIETLCHVAGLSFRDLADRAIARGVPLPGKTTVLWSQEQAGAAFAVIDEIVEGRGEARLPGAVAARPVELALADESGDGWRTVEEFRQCGVPYDVLLTQRAVGGAWLAHRNSTTTRLAPTIANELCDRLDRRGVAYWRGTQLGGDTTKKRLGELVGRESGQVGLVTKTPEERPSLAVAVAVARDGGTARKTAGKLLQLPARTSVSVALLLLGGGWSERGETAELVPPFGGRIFSERTLDDLGDLAQDLINNEGEIDA